MSDNNFPCGKCGGSGKKVSDNCGYTNHCGDDTCDASTFCETNCPSCNKGNVQLAVGCGTCGGEGKQKFMGAYGGVIRDCPDCTNGYRPLTDSEVRELEKENSIQWEGQADWGLLIPEMNDGLITLKGSQVVLIPTTN